MAAPSFGQNSLHNTEDLASSVLDGDISGAPATFDVLDGSRFPSANFVVKVEGELIFISSRSTNTLTVGARAHGSTTQVDHLDGAQVIHVLSATHVQELSDQLLKFSTGLDYAVSFQDDVQLKFGTGDDGTIEFDSASSLVDVAGVGWNFNAPAGAGLDGLNVDMTGLNASDNNGIRVFTNSDTQDTTAGIKVENEGTADAIYVGSKGEPSGATEPTGIGIDMNRGAGGTENNTLYTGNAIAILNWSDVATQGVGIKVKNQNAGNTTNLLRLTTNGNALQIAPVDDTTGDLRATQARINNAAGSYNLWNLQRNGFMQLSNGLQLRGGPSNANQNDIPTSSSGGSNALNFTDTTSGSPNGKTLRVSGGDLQLLRSAGDVVIGSWDESGDYSWKSGTTFDGTFTHAITAARTWTFPDTTGDVVVETGTAAADTNAPTHINTPTGVAAAQTEWLTVVIDGNTRYIPLWG